MKKKIITIVTSSNFSSGGANVAAKRVGDALSNFFLIKRIAPQKKSLIDYFKIFSTKIFLKLFIKKKIFLNSLNFFSRIDLTKYQTDIFNLHWIGDETISLSQISKIKKPIIWTLHDMWAFTSTEHFLERNENNFYSNIENLSLLKKFFLIKKKIFYNKNLNFVTNSEWLETLARKSYLLKNFNIKTIYNPVDTKIWKRDKSINLKKKLNLNRSKRYILFGAHGGLVNYRKGGDLFIDSLKYIKYLNKDVEIVVLGGDRNFVDKINGFIFHFRKISFNLRIQISYHSIANITVVPSRAESIPQFAVETLLCNNPVVAFNIGGFNEILENKKSGYLAKPFDIKDFSKGIEFSLNKIVSKNLEKNRENIVRKFDDKLVGREYKNLINRILLKS
jgi:glycosyltransferase involved in cell wall biosynthesis